MPISRVLGLDLSLLWALSGVLGLDLGLFWAQIGPLGGSGTGLGPFRGVLSLDSGHFRGFFAYSKFKSAHFGDLGLDLGHFDGTWTWI